MVDYQRFMGRGSALNSELWVILLGLQVAKHRGIGKVVVESDCFMAVDKIKSCLEGGPALTIVQKIQEIAQHYVGFKIQHVERQHNLVADSLAKNCPTNIIDICLIDIPSSTVNKLLMADSNVAQDAGNE